MDLRDYVGGCSRIKDPSSSIVQSSKMEVICPVSGLCWRRRVCYSEAESDPLPKWPSPCSNFLGVTICLEMLVGIISHFHTQTFSLVMLALSVDVSGSLKGFMQITSRDPSVIVISEFYTWTIAVRYYKLK